MAVDVSAEIEITRPRADVAAYATDPANDTEWIGGIGEARMLTEPPVAVGTQVERVASFLGRRIEYVLEVSELEPDARIVMRSVKSPFPMVVTYTFADADAGTLAGIRVQGDATGFYRLAAPLLAMQVRRSIAGDLSRLKQIVES